MNIRPATLQDFEELYQIGKSTPELQVSATEAFMDADEFQWSLTNPNGVFSVAEAENQIIGFIYANIGDIEKPMKHTYACLIYLVIIPQFRKQGVAQALYSQCEVKLKARGVTHIYSWANMESDGSIIQFMKKQGYMEGHAYVWMDKKIT